MESTALSPALVELYSDIFKIGIPSLIAIVSAIFSFILSIKGHQKDIYIENLRADLEREKDKNVKVSQLINDISFNISELHAVTVQYATNKCVMQESFELNETYPEKEYLSLKKTYADLTGSIYKGTDTKTKVYLLGNQEIIKMFEKFWGSTAELTHKFSPEDNCSRQLLMKDLISVGEMQENLLLKLSGIYLNATIQ